MSRRRLLVIVSLATILQSCVIVPKQISVGPPPYSSDGPPYLVPLPQPPFATLPRDLQDTYLAVIHYLLADSKRHPSAASTKLFLNVHGSDAPEDLRAQLSIRGRTILPGHQYRYGAGIRMNIHTSYHPVSSEMMIIGVYQFGRGGDGFDGGYFLLRKQNGRWKIISFKRGIEYAA